VSIFWKYKKIIEKTMALGERKKSISGNEFLLIPNFIEFIFLIVKWQKVIGGRSIG
jgi:hypothetical protein